MYASTNPRILWQMTENWSEKVRKKVKETEQQELTLERRLNGTDYVDSSG